MPSFGGILHLTISRTYGTGNSDKLRSVYSLSINWEDNFHFVAKIYTPELHP